MYLCAFRPTGESLSRRDVFRYVARLNRTGHRIDSIVAGPFAAFGTIRPGATRRMARWRQLIGAGEVRLDHRADVARLARVKTAQSMSDLELVLAALEAVGEACVSTILGDFAFVIWDAHAQKVLAVRDAFGVKPLYQRTVSDLMLFSSEMSPLRYQDAYDVDYLADFMRGSVAPGTRTVWRDIAAVPAGGIVRQRGTLRNVERYWQVDNFQVDGTAGDETSCVQFRELLQEGVETRLTGCDDVWAELSGGLDSSTVVALAASSAEGPMLGGTITVVDSLGDGDERAFSDLVVRRLNIRHVQVHDYWAWQDDGEPPPITDHPTQMFPFFARDRKVRALVHNAGARVLLSGFGADHYLYGSLDYITDQVAACQWQAALRELMSWSIATRQSFWTLGRRYLLDPFLPQSLQLRSARRRAEPLWLMTAAARCAKAPFSPSAIPYRRFAATVAAAIDALPAWIDRWPFSDHVEVRYPFLYRPLVEFSLRLPPAQRLRPNQHKWILRQVTRDLLPEQVRTRRTKGGIDARILWSLQKERARINRMLRDPILAQLGCVDAQQLRAAVELARRGMPLNNVHLFSTLALETWLAVSAGSDFMFPQQASATEASFPSTPLRGGIRL